MAVPLYQAKAEFFRTLGHPVRIRVLELLADGEKPVHALREAIDVEAASLSQQLAVLRLAGLVSQRRESGEVIYALGLASVRDLLAVAREVLRAKTGDQGDLVDDLSRPTADSRQTDADSRQTDADFRQTDADSRQTDADSRQTDAGER